MHNHQPRERKYFDIRTLFGLAIILAGIVLLLDNVFNIDLGIRFWDLWPLVLIVIGINQLSRPSEARQLMSGLIFIVVGALFLGNNFDIFYFRFSDIWPIVLILVGIAILRHSFSGGKPISDTDYINLSFVLGGGDFKFTSQTLAGGKITAIMGGGKIDLRAADMQADQMVFDLFTMWGGIELQVPETWEVSLQGTPIMGGMEDKSGGYKVADNEKNDTKPKKLIVKGMAIMGGVEVKN